jgi:hypothetical protein
MNWFYNLRIARKLLLTFAAILHADRRPGVFSIVQLARVNQASTDIATNSLPSVRYPLEAKARWHASVPCSCNTCCRATKPTWTATKS